MAPLLPLQIGTIIVRSAIQIPWGLLPSWLPSTMAPALTLQIGTLIVRSAQTGNIEITLKSFRKMSINMAVLTEMKLNHDHHTTFWFGYNVCAPVARSSSQGGVAFAFNHIHNWLNMSLFCKWCPDVISIMMTSGQ